MGAPKPASKFHFDFKNGSILFRRFWKSKSGKSLLPKKMSYDVTNSVPNDKQCAGLFRFA